MERSTEVTERSAFPLGKVARCCAHWRCIVTDEVRPPSVGVTAARTFAILWLAAEPPRLPLRREARALPRRAQIWCCVLFNIPHSAFRIAQNSSSMGIVGMAFSERSAKCPARAS